MLVLTYVLTRVAESANFFAGSDSGEKVPTMTPTPEEGGEVGVDSDSGFDKNVIGSGKKRVDTGANPNNWRIL